MNYRMSIFVVLCFFSMPSQAMDYEYDSKHSRGSSSKHSNGGDYAPFDLTGLLNTALYKAERKYNCLEDLRKGQNRADFKNILNDTIAECMEKSGVSQSVLPVIHSILVEEFRCEPLLYSMNLLYRTPNQETVNSIDINKNGMRIVAGIGNGARLWIKDNKRQFTINDFWGKDESWISQGVMEYASPVTAVCFGDDDTVVTANQEGMIALLRYQEGELKQDNAFKLPDNEYATMIALDNKGSRLAYGNSEKASGIHVYERKLAHWNREEADIPIFQIMKPTALRWTDQDTLIAYGKALCKVQDVGSPCSNSNQGQQQADERAVTEWQRIACKWYSIRNIRFDVDAEHEILEKAGCKLTQRHPSRAVSESGAVKVSVVNDIIKVGYRCPVTYENIANYLADRWS